MGRNEVGMAHQAVVTMTLQCQLVWLDSCYQSQGRLVATESSAARKVIIQLLILLSLAEHEGSWSHCGAGASCYLEGEHGQLWGSLYTDPGSLSKADAAEAGR